VCILYCGCFKVFCNVWVCVCVGVLVICVLVFTVFLYCFIYVNLFLNFIVELCIDTISINSNQLMHIQYLLKTH